MTKENVITPIQCGIVMPISKHDSYKHSHWGDVLNIFKQAMPAPEFETKLVSHDNAVGLIQERIVNNLYFNDVVVCDVSSKNPNVMFELGLRLAFDKPTIIVKDELTNFSFDTSGIEHLSYPSTLRFSEIVAFKAELLEKVRASIVKSKADPDYSPFLKSFGRSIAPSSLQKSEISESKYIIEQIENLRRDMNYAIRHQRKFPPLIKSNILSSTDLIIKVIQDYSIEHGRPYTEEEVNLFRERVSNFNFPYMKTDDILKLFDQHNLGII
ncbi:hypothetical protein [Penaeicola halotolerans]|uniref:hypothetical protein n=1 Tax=Penaeicola halotolerans TaxID=2793196 RepID=UPI001CF90575|nr:hypothetical protein [Penaeicola halotolerans]